MKKVWALISMFVCMGMNAYAGPTNFPHGLRIDASEAVEQTNSLTLQMDTMGITLTTGKTSTVLNTLGARFVTSGNTLVFNNSGLTLVGGTTNLVNGLINSVVEATNLTMNFAAGGLTLRTGTMSTILNTLGVTQRNVGNLTLVMNGSTGVLDTIAFPIIVSLSAATNVAGMIMGVAGTIVDVRAYALTGPDGSINATLDVNKNGTTIYTTQANRLVILTLATGGIASSTTAPDVTAVAAGDRITIDVDHAGSVGAMNVMVTVTIRRTTF